MTDSSHRDDLPRFAELEAEYEILRELGRGGTAVVYLARERELGREVAIKVIRTTYIEDAEATARLVREAHMVGGLQHPHIVVLYGTKRLRDRSLALIMQYVHGRTLKSELRAHGPLPVEQVTQVLSEVGSALVYAHRHRIVHRDIKPENIYLDDENGIARLADFGIARMWDARSNLTLPGSAIGTPTYMSPEQIDGGALDGRSDLYSLALVGYEMLTGEPPWHGENLFGIIYRQKHEELPPIDTFRADIPRPLRRAIEGALYKDPADRWADAGAFLAALNATIPETPGDAGPASRRKSPSTRRRARKPPALPDAPTIRFRPAEADDVPAPAPIEPAPREVKSRRRTASAAAFVLVSPDDAPSVAAAEVDGAEEPKPADPAGARDSSPDDGVAIDAADEAAAAIPAPPAPVAGRHPTESTVASPASSFDAVPIENADAPPVARPVQIAPVPKTWRSRRGLLVAAIASLLLAGAAATIAMTLRGARGDGPAAPSVARPAEVEPAPAASSRPESRAASAAILSEATAAAVVGDTLTPRLRVADAAGNPLLGITVRFAGAGARLVPEVVLTDEQGIASTQWIPDQAGEHSLEAVVDGLPAQPVMFRALVAAPAPARLAASSTTLRARGGARVPVTVNVRDERDRPLAGVAVAFEVRRGSGSVSSERVTTAEDGTARVEWMVGEEGAQELSAAVDADEVDPVLFTATLEPRPLAVRSTLAVGGTHTCFLGADGDAACWGGNDSGQLGDGSSARRGAPVPVDAPEPLAYLSAGVSHTCALGVSGQAFCWGTNAAGQLGTGNPSGRLEPAPVDTDVRMTSIATGMAHSCGLDSAGRLYCWGENGTGQLGDGTLVDRPTPVRAGGDRTFRSVTLGWAHTCALASDGAAWCWGRNASGELGDGTADDRTRPVAVRGGHVFRSIAAGSAHTCGLRQDGVVLCWGQNEYGQLGNSTTSSSRLPVAVASEFPFGSLAVGGVHSCALSRDGAAYCWGRNTYGQLGDGTNRDRPRPATVAGGHRFTALQASGAHTCGTVAGGARMCWGYNLEGQLGDGTRTNQSRPVAVVRPW